jgi:hypothetical protein
MATLSQQGIGRQRIFGRRRTLTVALPPLTVLFE